MQTINLLQLKLEGQEDRIMEVHFNARLFVENLRKNIKTNTKYAFDIIKAACILHNFVKELDGCNDIDIVNIREIVPDPYTASPEESIIQLWPLNKYEKKFTDYFIDHPINNNG